MGHIQDRGQDGGRKRWRARIRSPSGRERSKSFDRKIDARRWLTEQEHRRDVGQWVDPAAGRRHFGKWLDEWLDSRRRQVRPSTYARDESYCRNHLRPEFGDVPLSAISQPHVVAWVGELDEDKDLAAATVKKAYTLLSQVLQAAVDAGLLPTSPCSNVPLPRDEPAEMRLLSPGEVARLADVADPRYRAMVLLAAYGGLRLGELTGLRRRCNDTRAGQVKIVETLTWVRGDPYFGPPKTAAGRRRVAVPETVRAELSDHLDGHAGPSLVFPDTEGGPLRHSNFRRNTFLPAVQAAGLGHLRIHDLRHTAVALWIAAGADVKAVAVRAGHTSVAFTLDRYGHLYPDRDAALADRLDEMAVEAEQSLAGRIVQFPHSRQDEPD